MKRRLLTALSALTVILAMASPVGATGPALQSGPDSDDVLRSETALGARADSDKLEYRAADVRPAKTDPLAGAEDGVFIIRLRETPVSTYRGGIDGFTATNPETVGREKLNADSPAVRSYVGFLESRQADALASIEREIQRSVEALQSYTFAANGFALDLTVEEARAISRLPGVESVRPDAVRQLETDVGPAWIGAPGLWGTDCGDYCGEGILIGVLDTGINPENPSFAEVGPNDGYVHVNPFGADTFVGVCDPADDSYDASFACNDKLVGAWSFLDYPNSSPIDDDGHGSHTASTAGGNFVDAVVDAPTLDIFPTLSGVAPHANLIAYDVCDEDGCPLSAILAGIDQAIADGVDVINYSIGGGAVDPWSEDDTVGFLQARAAGIFVATSAGNDGPDAGTIGGPADAPWMTSVAAQTHDREWVNSLIDMTGGDTAPPADIEGLGFTSGYGPAEIVYAGDVPSAETDSPELCGVGSIGDFDSPWDPGTFSGEIVVCDRGTFGRVEKGANVLAAGAGGYVLVDNGSGLVSDPHELPGVHITESDGDVLKAWLAGGADHMATIAGATKSVSDDNADILAGFSSRGPNPTNETLSPDVSAPGVGIIAAHGTGGETVWTFLSGTSMASPHVAGSAALLLQSTDWTPAEIESALMMTAYDGVLDTDGSPATWLEQGAGRVRVDVAMTSGLVIDETSGDFEDADPAEGGDPKALNIASATNHECVIVCSWTRTVEATTAGTWDAAAVAADFDLSVPPTNFSLAEGETQELTITADVLASVQDVFLFGEINLTGTGPDLHIPVTVRSTRGDLPDLVEISTARNAGSVVAEDVTAVEITQLTIEHSGFSKASQQLLELSEDSANGSPYDDLADGVFYTTVEVDPDQWRLVAETFDASAPDIDLYVGTGETPSEATEVCSSTTPSATEYCNVWDPAPGTWWILVQNWDGVEAPATDTVMLSYGTAGADEGNMLVSGPPDQPELEPFDLRIFWDLDDAAADDRYYGAFSLGTDPGNPGFVGRAPIDLIRHPDDVVKTADNDNPFPGETVEFTITVNPNVTHEDLMYQIVDHIPDGLTYVPGSATGGLQLRSDGALTWTGTMPSPFLAEPLYSMTTNATDNACVIPLADLDGDAGAYLDLEGFGIPTDPGITGDTVAFFLPPLVIDYDFYGEVVVEPFLTDDGFVGYDVGEYAGEPWIWQNIPDLEPPNALAAPAWFDWQIFYDGGANQGVTVATLSSGPFDVATVVEYDNMEPFGGGPEILDFEIFQWTGRDDSPGAWEMAVAFDNIAFDFPVTVGVENFDGTNATAFINDGFASDGLADDLVVCFDVQVPEFPPHVMTYEATVDEGTDGTFVTNTAYHVTDNKGDEQAAASVEIGLGDVDAPVWNGAELTVHDKLSDSLRLEWDAATDNVAVFAYDVYVNGGHAGTVGPSTFDFHVGGLVPQSFNEFAVIARDEVGNESVPLETSATMATDFLDDDFSIFEDDIEWANGNGLFFGCNPPANTMVCPDLNLTRGQLAALIARALDLPPGPDAFGDDDGHVFEGDINAIAAAGIAHGCAPGQFCPDDPATRAQLAAMFKAAFGLPDTATDYASDDDGHQFEDAINSMYETGITFGCGVDKYCPDDPLTRGMASAFFRRAFRWKGWS